MTAEQKPVLIVIDDEPGILEVVGRFAARAGFEVVACAGGREGIAKVQSTHADLAMVDLRMPDVGGLEVLRAIRDSNPNCQAVLMTGYASVDTAVEAVKLGAMDYLSKPLDFGRLQQMFTTVQDEIERRRSVLSIERDLARRLEFCGMIGRGPLMQDLFALIRRLAPHVRDGARSPARPAPARSSSPARSIAPGRAAIGRSSPSTVRRWSRPLFESELFGHVRGALHRRHRQQAGAVRGGGRRHAVPRRDRRAAAQRPGQAAARPRAGRGAPRRIAGAAPGQRARHRRHQSRPAR